MTVLCALDLSINSPGIAILEVIDIDNLTFKVISKVSFKHDRKYDNSWAKKEAVLEMFEFYMAQYINLIDFCVFENYSYSSPGYLADAGELNGLIKHYLFQNSIPFDFVSPQTVKRLVGGSGKCSKEDVRAGLSNFVLDFDNLSFNNFDESDAIAIGVSFLLFQKEIANGAHDANKSKKRTKKRKDIKHS